MSLPGHFEWNYLSCRQIKHFPRTATMTSKDSESLGIWPFVWVPLANDSDTVGIVARPWLVVACNSNELFSNSYYLTWLDETDHMWHLVSCDRNSSETALLIWVLTFPLVCWESSDFLKNMLDKDSIFWSNLKFYDYIHWFLLYMLLLTDRVHTKTRHNKGVAREERN